MSVPRREEAEELARMPGLMAPAALRSTHLTGDPRLTTVTRSGVTGSGVGNQSHWGPKCRKVCTKGPLVSETRQKNELVES